MEDNETIVESIVELLYMIDHMPENTVLEIIFDKEDDEDG